MKKVTGLLLGITIAVLISQASSTIVAAKIGPIVGSPKLAVLVDGRKVQFQGGDPISENGRVQVPLRGIGEALGAEVGYRGQTVTYQKEGKSISLTIGSKLARVDGNSITMDTAAKAVKGRTYVPLRFVSENLGEPVSWDQVGNWVWIGDKTIPDITEVTELESLKEYADYFKGKEERYLVSGSKTYTDARVVTYDKMPVVIDNITLMDMWMVTDGENFGIHVRFKGPKKFNMYYLAGNGDIRQRSGYIIEQSDGTYIAQFEIRTGGDNAIYGDKNWEKYNIKNIDYFYIIGGFNNDDSKHFINNPLK